MAVNNPINPFGFLVINININVNINGEPYETPCKICYC